MPKVDVSNFASTTFDLVNAIRYVQLLVTGEYEGDVLVMETDAKNMVGAVNELRNSLLWETINFEETATDYLYGFLRGSEWKVNKFDKATVTKTSADEVTDPAYTDLPTAWTNRATLSYT